MRIVVAGGAGFIGSHLVELLLRHGHQVTVIDNLSTGSVSNLGGLERWPFRFIRGDVRTVADLKPLGPEVIVHLASAASPLDYWADPLGTLGANSIGTFRLLSSCRSSGAAFVYASTSEVYGDPLVHPQPESYWGNVDPVGPRSMYDEAKRFGEALTTAESRTNGVRSAIVRIFNTYGPRMRKEDGRVIPELLAAARAGKPLPIYGSGQQTRSFCFVSDLVKGLALVIEDPKLGGDPRTGPMVLNLGNPEEVTVADLAGRVARLTAHRAGLVHLAAREGDPQQRRPDIERMQARYAWRPEVSLDEGLKRTADWWPSR